MTSRLTEIRKEKGFTQKYVSSETGIPQNTLSNYENGNREPTLVVWKTLADYYGVGVEWLRGNGNDKYDFKGWEDATGYTQEQIEDCLKKLDNIGALSGDMQQDIGLVIDTFEGGANGHGDLSAIKQVENLLQQIPSQIERDYYLDPNKPIKDKLGGTFIREKDNDWGAAYYYDDMDRFQMALIQTEIVHFRRIMSVSANTLRDVKYAFKVDDINDNLAFIDDLIEDMKASIYKVVTQKFEQLNSDAADNNN